MGRYIIRRVISACTVLLGVWTIVFLLLRLSGDPVLLFVDIDATAAEIEVIRRNLGLDRPLIIQYLSSLQNVLQGDFGQSLRYDRPALLIVLSRIPATVELTGAALALTVALGIPAGVIAATHRGSIWDSGVSLLALVGQSVPFFWIGMLLILLFSVTLGWLPVQGRGSLLHLLLPSITVSWYFLARVARLTQAGMLAVLREDYVRTARSKGLGERVVIYRHALRNASLSIVTVVGLTFQALVSGAVVTETIFSWPGMGTLLVQAVFSRDYAVVQAAVLLTAVFVTLANLIVDLTYAYLDPRIRFG